MSDKLRTPADALRDPRPGDAVIYDPKRQSAVVEVVFRDGGHIHTLTRRSYSARYSIRQWRDLMTDAEVLHVAQEGGEG